jgi:hypothetical protein
MQFQVPQFVEHEARIVGPFTFKQFIFIGIAGAVLLLLYFMVPFFIFLLACFILGGGSLVLALVKIEGHPLPTIIKNFFVFLLSSKVYLWRKKLVSPRLIKEKPELKEELPEKPVLKVAERGHLSQLSTKVETRVR